MTTLILLLVVVILFGVATVLHATSNRWANTVMCTGFTVLALVELLKHVGAG